MVHAVDYPIRSGHQLHKENTLQIEYESDDGKFQTQIRLQLDGVSDEFEKRRNAAIQRQNKAATGSSRALGRRKRS
jgi:hypothetical protein